MNKFSVALVSVTFAARAQASTLSASAATIQPPAGPYQGKPSFSIGSAYQEPDYTQAYQEREPLPSGDFNRRVHNFDNHREIWDQKDYEERVKVEAELLVALEALKENL